jgi:hypothetical protein
MTFMQSGVSWFAQEMIDAAGKSVNFIRNGIRTPLTAWVTQSSFEVVDTSGVPVEITTRDYKFRTADLGGLIPRRGDRFSEVIDGIEHTVELMPLSSDPATNWVDNDGKITIAHCKTIKINAGTS